MSIVFTDRRTGNQIMLKGVELTPKRLASDNLGLGTSTPSYFAKRYSDDIDDLHKIVPHTNELPDRQHSTKHQKAIFDDRVPPDLRNRILDLLDRTDRVPDTMRAGTWFSKARNDLAADILNRVDLPATVTELGLSPTRRGQYHGHVAVIVGGLDQRLDLGLGQIFPTWHFGDWCCICSTVFSADLLMSWSPELAKQPVCQLDQFLASG